MKLLLFHIAYSAETYLSTPSGFKALDNRSNERSDWFEYWPIRRDLPAILEGMQEDDFLGFFSPRFSEKTGLTADILQGYVSHYGSTHDVLLFSPQPDIAAFFTNVFLGEDFFNPGFFLTAQDTLTDIGVPIELSRLVNDSRNTVFSNYFLAKPAFWRSWSELCEKIFDLAESDDTSNLARTDIRRRLTQVTTYGGGTQVKVFLIERITSMMLAAGYPNPWRAKAYEPFKLAWSAHFTHSQNEAVLCDALKIAFQASGFEAFATQFQSLQTEVIARVLKDLQT